MRLPRALTNRIWNALFSRVAIKRPPDFLIGGLSDPYMMRWWLLGGRYLDDGRQIAKSFAGLVFPYLHCFRRSDDDRALHDHPAASISLILCGECVEVLADGSRRKLTAGKIIVRSAKMAHRIEINRGDCWTLFIFGPKTRSWGFHCERGWVHWKEFTAPGASGDIGRGCD